MNLKQQQRMQQQQQRMQKQQAGAIQTKKYKLEPKMYVTMALKSVLMKFWWAFLVPVAIMLIPVFYQPALGWCIGIAITLTILWVLFWVIQFTGITQMEQYKFIFEKVYYQINSRQILIMMSAQQGMPLTWDKVLSATKGKDHYLLKISLAQFIYLPFDVFKSEHHIKTMDNILRRKGFLPSEANTETK